MFVTDCSSVQEMSDTSAAIVLLVNFMNYSIELTQAMEDEGSGRGEGTHVCHRLLLGLPSLPNQNKCFTC